jgi:hypothetical protein
MKLLYKHDIVHNFSFLPCIFAVNTSAFGTGLTDFNLQLSIRESKNQDSRTVVAAVSNNFAYFIQIIVMM